MKKITLGFLLLAVCSTFLAAPAAVAEEPSCKWVAKIKYWHITCQVWEETNPYGWDEAGCQAKVDNLLNVILVQFPYSNPSLVESCHPVGRGCKVAQSDDPVG